MLSLFGVAGISKSKKEYTLNYQMLSPDLANFALAKLRLGLEGIFSKCSLRFASGVPAGPAKRKFDRIILRSLLRKIIIANL
jgi:hypothetical protein